MLFYCFWLCCERGLPFFFYFFTTPKPTYKKFACLRITSQLMTISKTFPIPNMYKWVTDIPNVFSGFVDSAELPPSLINKTIPKIPCRVVMHIQPLRHNNLVLLMYCHFIYHV